MKRVLNLCVLALSITLATVFASKGQWATAWLFAFAGPAVATPWGAHMLGAGLLHDLSIPEHYMRAFQANWDHTVQQETAKLARLVTIDQFDGKEKIYTDIDQVSFTEKRARLQKTVLNEVTGSKRKMTRRDFSCHYIFDRGDKQLLGMLGQPDSELQVEMRYAFQRSLDEGVAEAASATVYGGADPYVTAITLPSTQKVAVDYVFTGSTANSGLTPAKLQRAVKLIEDQDQDLTAEDFFLAIGPKQKEDLFTYALTAPNDKYAAMIVDWYNDPMSKKLFGFTTKITNRLEHNTSTDVRTCFAWSRRGIYACPDKLEVKINERADMEHAIQISAYGQWGFMRRREERVVQILCDESP